MEKIITAPAAEQSLKPETEKYVFDIEQAYHEFEIKPGEPVAADKVYRLLAKYGDKIADNARKNFWRRLQGVMVHGDYATPTFGRWGIYLVNKYDQKANLPPVEMRFRLGRTPDQEDSYWFNLIFAYEGEDSRRLRHDQYEPENIRLKKISLKSQRRLQWHPVDLDLDSAAAVEAVRELPKIELPFKEVDLALRQAAVEQEKEMPEVKRILADCLKGLKGKDREGVVKLYKKMYQAIKEFSAYMYSEGKASVGDCFVVPLHFESFCRQRFGINLETRHYGMPDTMGMSDDEAERLYETTKKKGSYHEVNIFNRQIAIDWTGTQFGAKFRHRPTGMPAIYVLTEDEKEELFTDYRGRKI